MRRMIVAAAACAALAPMLAATESEAASRVAHAECAAQYGVNTAVTLEPIGPQLYLTRADENVPAATAALINDCARVESFLPVAEEAEEVVVRRRNVLGQILSTYVICPYPHRYSDAAFSRGSGYITKDAAREIIGCNRRR